MKKRLGIIVLSSLFVAAMGLTFGVPFLGTGQANACGVNGSKGGEDYVPQRRNPDASRSKTSLMTREQAYDVVAKHITKVNPRLKIGEMKDAGSFFETEIVDKDNKFVELLGVDKQSGRLMVLN